MGFYGNITNTSRTQFQFDRTYPNRYDMETHKNTDNVYAGRYVLVEYDSTANLDTYLRVQTYATHDVGNTTYYTFNFNPIINGQAQQLTQLTREIVKSDSDFIVYTSTVYTDVSGGVYHRDVKFFSYVDIPDPYNSGMAMFIAITGSMDNIPNYSVNYNIDTSIYGAGRGYDSTVWQKVYMDGVEKYIMIAELNTVVPTFDVSADAPTLSPIIPHFDTKSTDIYYKLHWQPTWGMRVASASNEHPSSDEVTIWTREVYDDTTGITTPYYWDYNKKEWTVWEKGTTPADLPAAIYYNAIGFRPEFSIHSTEQNIINVTPTGISGNMYNKHDGTQDKEALPDIQEVTILLPAIGNAIATVWDTMYGHDIRTLPITNDQGQVEDATLDFRYRDIDWKDVQILTDDYQGDLSKGGMTYKVNTIAGCINEVHRLMGMILTEKKDEYLNKEWYDKHYLYCDSFMNEKDGKYPQGNIFRIYEYPVYETPFTVSSLLGEGEIFPQRDKFPSDQEYNTAYENFIKDKLPEDAYYKVLTDITFDAEGNLNIPSELEVCSFNKNALKETDYITYHKYEQQDESSPKEFLYSYRYQIVDNIGKSLNTIYGSILQMKKLLEVENSETRDTSTATGAINKLNDIINVFENLIPGEFLYCDTTGKVNSANWTTAQPFGYTNHKALNANTQWKTIGDRTNYETAPVAKENIVFTTEENRWISMELDEDNRLITIKHEFNPVPDTTTISDKNVEGGDGINKAPDDLLQLYTPIIDNMGHVVGHNIETITLPYNYKSIKSNELVNVDNEDLYTTIVTGTDTVDAVSSAAVDDDIMQTSASNSKDLMNINTKNKWIQTKVTDDTLEIAHEIHAIKEVVRQHDLNGLKEEGYHQDKITVQDTEYDAAGHVITNRKHTYTLPFGFKYITSNGRGDDVEINSETEPDVPNIVADDTQSAFAINSGNRWVRIDNVDGTTNSLTIKHDIHPTSSSTSTKELEIEKSEEVTFEIPTYVFDEAGHYVSHDTKTLYMPFSYGKITGDVSIDKSENTTIASSATYDTLTLATDEWLTTTVDQANDKVTFSHDYPYKVDDTTSSLDMNDSKNTVDQKNKIVLETLSRDATGHVTTVNQHTVTLPYNYKTITVDKATNTTKDIDAKEGSIIADNTQDELTLTPGNKWIHLTADINDDKVTFSHEVNSIEVDQQNTKETWAHDNLNTENNATAEYNINIPDWTYDEAGHITSKKNHTYTLPYGYKTFKDSNTNIGTSIASSTQDTFVFKGDSWIKPTITNDQLEITHIGPVPAQSYTTKNNVVNPSFGSTFTIEDWHYDDKGHKNNLTTHTVQFPKGSLSDTTANGADVVTQLAFDADSGALSTTRTNIANLKLTSYTKKNEATGIAATDTLSEALSKLQTQVDTEKARIDNLNVTDTAVTGKYVSAVSQSDGQISVTHADFPAYLLISEFEQIIASLNDRIKALEDLVLPQPDPEETPEELTV